jgi:hypothetical protein
MVSLALFCDRCGVFIRRVKDGSHGDAACKSCAEMMRCHREYVWGTTATMDDMIRKFFDKGEGN